MGEIWLIRHGQASFGASNYDKLSKTGIRQSGILGSFFSRIDLDFDQVYSGRMERQIDTAKIVMSHANGGGDVQPLLMEEFDEYDHMGIIKSQIPFLKEEDPSIVNDLQDITKQRKQFRRFFDAIMKRWVSGAHDAPGIETFVEYGRRIEQGIETVAETNGSGGRIAVFTSGGVISLVMRMALGLSNWEAMLLGWRVLNTSVSVFKHARGRLNLVSFNSTAHLDLETDAELRTIN